MDTMHIQLRVWTTQPSTLLREVMCHQYDPALIEADELVKHSRFNGLFVIFRLSEAQCCALEDTTAHLNLRHERCQDTLWYDTRWYPNNNPYEMGAHDAEIDMWHVKTLAYPHCYEVLTPQSLRTMEETSPQEALMNRTLRIRQALERLNAISAEQRNTEVIQMMTRYEGYLARVHQEFPHLARSR